MYAVWVLCGRCRLGGMVCRIRGHAAGGDVGGV